MSDDFNPMSKRFLSKISRSDDGCWLWTASLSTNGYGQFRIDGVLYAAHRLVYEAACGPVPDGLELDHLCGVRRCVRLDHLECVTHHENVLRGNAPPSINAHKQVCVNGHPLVPGNVVPSSAARNGRECLTCHRQRAKRNQDILRDAGIAVGLTQKQYRAKYGSSLAVAKQLIAGEVSV